MLIRNAGWTFAECDEQPACDVWDFLGYCKEYPSADDILAAVHLKPKPKKMTEAEMQANLPELQSMLGGAPARPVPQELRDTLAWAEEQSKRMAGKG